VVGRLRSKSQIQAQRRVCFYTLYQSGKCPARNTDRRAATVQLSVAVAVAHQSLVTHGTGLRRPAVEDKLVWGLEVEVARHLPFGSDNRVAANKGCDHKASSETAVVLRSQDMAPHEGEEQAEVAGQDIGLAPEEVASSLDCRLRMPQAVELQWVP
jgi:hypothetical protein